MKIQNKVLKKLSNLFDTENTYLCTKSVFSQWYDKISQFIKIIY